MMLSHSHMLFIGLSIVTHVYPQTGGSRVYTSQSMDVDRRADFNQPNYPYSHILSVPRCDMLTQHKYRIQRVVHIYIEYMAGDWRVGEKYKTAFQRAYFVWSEVISAHIFRTYIYTTWHSSVRVWMLLYVAYRDAHWLHFVGRLHRIAARLAKWVSVRDCALYLFQ